MSGEDFCYRRDEGESSGVLLVRIVRLIVKQAALVVLVRDFEFAHRDKNTVIGRHRSIVDRPKVVGEEGARVPLIVRRVA
jgi:hypothetical protein